MKIKRPLLSGLLLSISQSPIVGMLDVSSDAVDTMVEALRSHIFVDRRHVVPVERAHACDSLSGPHCASDAVLHATGVVPEQYLRSLRVDFSVLHRALPLELWSFNYSAAVPDNFALPNPSSLLLNGLPDGGRITTRYSLSLPSGSGFAKLEGRWLLEDSVSMETFLPAYVRFSEPVIVGRLWAELTLPPDLDVTKRSVVIVAFRLGTETVWTTEAIMDHGFTMDLTSRGIDGHGPLRACDQIVIYSTVRGLKIVSIEFENAQDEVLVPTVLLVPSSDGSLMFKTQRVDARMIANKQIVSVKEAIAEGYRLEFPTRANRTQLLAEVVARDANAVLPVDNVFRMVKTGALAVPHELKKAILKQESAVKRLSQSITRKALDLIVSPEESTSIAPAPAPEEDEELQTISDLFIAALMHL